MRYKAFDYSKLFPARIVVLPPWLSGEDDGTVTHLPLRAFLFGFRTDGVGPALPVRTLFRYPSHSLPESRLEYNHDNDRYQSQR
jgi:hypothetical protein